MVQAAPEGAAEAAASREMFVSTDWLAEHLEDVAILDIRGQCATQLVEPGVESSTYIALDGDYTEGHIPGAIFWSWTEDAIDTSRSVPAQMSTDADVFAAVAEEKGVSSERPVVVYDGGSGMFAARLWYMLTYHGHPHPLILQGGYKKWVDEGRLTESDAPCPLKVMSAGAEFVGEPRPKLRVDAAEILALIEAGDDNLVILDTRSADQQSGKVRRAARGGKIPTSQKLPRKSLLDPDSGLLKSDAELDAMLRERGVRPGDPSQRVVAYCNGGVAACTAAVALERLGCANWAVYDGSWNEWGNDAALPVEGAE